MINPRRFAGGAGRLALTLSFVLGAAVSIFLIMRDRPSAVAVGEQLNVVPGASASKPFVAPLPSASPSSVPPRSVGEDADAYRASLSAVSQEVAPLIAISANMKEYHDKLRGEGRDEAWATRSEAMLRAEFAKMEGVEKASRPIAINCGTTLCEVSGDNADPAGGANSPQTRSLGSPEREAMLWRQGYHSMGMMFGPGRAGQAFLGYYRREAPADVQAPPMLPVEDRPDAPGPG